VAPSTVAASDARPASAELLRVLADQREAARDPPLAADDLQRRAQLVDGIAPLDHLRPGFVETLPVVFGR
jgi:hypothetical protein